MTVDELRKEYEEKQKRAEENRRQFEEACNRKPSPLQKVWYYLTCWRPITKYEKIYLSKAIVENRLLLNQIVQALNKQTIILAEMEKRIGSSSSLIDSENKKDYMFG